MNNNAFMDLTKRGWIKDNQIGVVLNLYGETNLYKNSSYLGGLYHRVII